MRSIRVTALMIVLAALSVASSAFAEEKQPRWDPVWDIEEYDKCLRLGYGEQMSCCIDSGGRWDGPNAGTGKCVAPSAAPAKGGSSLRSPRLPGSNTIKQ